MGTNRMYAAVALAVLVGAGALGCDSEDPTKAELFRLTVVTAGDGNGVVTSSPTGIDCGTACQANFGKATEVTLTAAPESGSTFAGWDGAGCSGTSTCVVNMDEAKEVKATFLPMFTLEVIVEGTGSGKVTSDPAGIDCGNSCDHVFVAGTAVSLTAAATEGSTFDSWTGACAGTYSTCQITVDNSTQVTATFAEAGPTYEIGDVGPGGGIVFYDRESGGGAAQSQSGSWRYLEVAPASTEWVSKPWGGGSDHSVVTYDTVGAGLANTLEITQIHDPLQIGEHAAQLCLDLEHGGYSDWFLPSRDEFMLLQDNLHPLGLGGFLPLPGRSLVYYWTSSEHPTQPGSARVGIFYNDDRSPTISANPKGHDWDNQRTRAIRRF